MKTRLNNDLIKLRKKILEMLDMISIAYFDSIKALEEEDYLTSRIIIENDIKINDKETEIENLCMGILATQAPKAIDLRQVTVYIKVNTELERIGDYVKKLASMVSKTKGNKIKKYFTEIKSMSKNITDMIDLVRIAIREDNLDKVVEVTKLEEEIDGLFKQLVKSVIGNKELTHDEVINVILVSKQLERAGDHIVNICENLIYMIKGKKIELD